MFNNNFDLMEIAYEFVKNNPKKEHAFNDIVKYISDKKGIDKEAFDENLGSFYVELLRDTRFLITSNNKWILSESLSLNEYKTKKNDLYDFSSNDIKEDYDEVLMAIPELNDDLEEDKDSKFDYIDEDISNISEENEELTDEE